MECMRRLSELKQDQGFYFAALDGDLVLDAEPMGKEGSQNQG